MDKKSSYENIKNIEILKILWLKNMFVINWYWLTLYEIEKKKSSLYYLVTC